MTTVGAFEAKTHFSALLERAAQGEEIVITRHGRPVARLVPAAMTEEGQVDRAILALKSLRQGASLDGLSWQELRDAGRR
jgi:prevent-host-death family protein